MSSIDVLFVEENENSQSFTSGEFSWLPDASLPSRQNGIVHQQENRGLTLLSSTSSTDIKVEDIESNFSEILQENQSLKNDLYNNHALMQEQMKTILEWRERMLVAKTQQLEILEEAKKNVTALQEEKQALCGQIKVLENELLKNKESCKNCQNFQTITSDPPENLVEKTGSVPVLEQSSEFNLREYIVAVQFILENLFDSNKITADERNDLFNAVKGIIAVATKLQSSARDNLSKSSREVSNLEMILEEKDQQIEDILSNNSKEISNLETIINEKDKQIESLKAQKEESCSVVNDLTKQLSGVGNEGGEWTELQTQFKNLQVDYKLLERHHEKYKDNQEDGDPQVEKLTQKIDHLTAHLLDCQAKLRDQEEEIKNLMQQLAQAKLENEIIPLQEIQIKEFEEDLKQAIKTRDDAFAEIRKLENELKKYRKQFPESSSRKGSLAGLECPVCLEMFKNQSALEKHVERCLENNL